MQIVKLNAWHRLNSYQRLPDEDFLRLDGGFCFEIWS